MHAAYRRTSETHRLPFGAGADAVLRPVQRVSADTSAAARNVYGQDRRTNWPTMAVLGVVHAAMLAALVVFDVVPIMQPQKPVVMELIEVPQMVAPPPAAVEEPTPPDPVKPPLVNPDPVVQPPAPSPSPMLAVIRPPKIEAVAAALAKAAEGPPAPITPPDFNADYLNNPAPRYPVESRRLREQGTVAIKVLVGPEGTVQELKLAESSGHSRLDKAALSAVRKWRFAPAKQAGKPVAAWVIVPIPFVLQG